MSAADIFFAATRAKRRKRTVHEVINVVAFVNWTCEQLEKRNAPMRKAVALLAGGGKGKVGTTLGLIRRPQVLSPLGSRHFHND